MSRQQRTMPTRHAIARYWLERKEAPWSSHGWEYGEPACMACGWWKEEWDEESTIPKKWAASGLNRCHIVPRYMGGSDLCENLVLMCDICHSGQPDSLDPLQTFAYMRSVPGRMAAGSAELLAVGAAAEYERQMIRARTREGLAVKRSQGVRLGRPVQMPATIRAEVVRLRVQGLTFQMIADEMNRRGTPTATGKSFWYAATAQKATVTAALEDANQTITDGLAAASYAATKAGA